MEYKSVLNEIQDRFISEGGDVMDLFDLADELYDKGQERYQDSSVAIQKYTAEKQMWKRFGWLESFPGKLIVATATKDEDEEKKTAPEMKSEPASPVVLRKQSTTDHVQDEMAAAPSSTNSDARADSQKDKPDSVKVESDEAAAAKAPSAIALDDDGGDNENDADYDQPSSSTFVSGHAREPRPYGPNVFIGGGNVGTNATNNRSSRRVSYAAIDNPVTDERITVGTWRYGTGATPNAVVAGFGLSGHIKYRIIASDLQGMTRAAPKASAVRFQDIILRPAYRGLNAAALRLAVDRDLRISPHLRP